MMTRPHVAAGVVALAISFAATYLTRRIARRTGMLDHPGWPELRLVRGVALDTIAMRAERSSAAKKDIGRTPRLKRSTNQERDAR